MTYDEAGNYLGGRDAIRYEGWPQHARGGMHVGMPGPGVKAIHLPTGISITSDTHRQQYRNVRDAIVALAHAVRQSGWAHDRS